MVVLVPVATEHLTTIRVESACRCKNCVADNPKGCRLCGCATIVTHIKNPCLEAVLKQYKQQMTDFNRKLAADFDLDAGTS